MADIKVVRFVTLMAATSESRMTVHQGREHLVIPTIMMVEGVVHAANADEPELVLADEFSRAPKGWNGRPVTGGHPRISGEYVSANSPDVLEREAFGVLFNTDVKGDRLFSEAWVDVLRAEQHPIGATVVRRARANEMIEVSVGAFILRDNVSGIYKGKKYSSIWRNPTPDHLAMLEEGGEGACSNEMGCGGMRAASAIHIVTNTGLVIVPNGAVEDEERTIVAEDKSKDDLPKRSLRERFLSLLPFGSEISELRDGVSKKDMTDAQLRASLDAALRAKVPGYMWIDSAQPFANTVVCAVMPEDHMVLLQYSYTLSADGVVALSGEGTEVVPETKFVPVAAEGQTIPSDAKEPQVAAAHKCGCAKEGEATMTKAQRIQALIDAKKFVSSDFKALEGFSDERLEELLKENPVVQKVEETAAKREEAKAEVEPTSIVGASAHTVEQYINAAPKAIQQDLRDAHAKTQEIRAAQIKALKDTGRCKFSDESLASFSSKQLDELIELAAVPKASYVGAVGAVSSHSSQDEDRIPRATGYVAAMQNRK